jgi:hypothetical protein
MFPECSLDQAQAQAARMEAAKVEAVIQEKFKAHSGNIQGTLSEHSADSGNIEGTFG